MQDKNHFICENRASVSTDYISVSYADKSRTSYVNKCIILYGVINLTFNSLVKYS